MSERRVAMLYCSRQDIGLLIEALASFSKEGMDARYVAQMTHAMVELENDFDKCIPATIDQLITVRDRIREAMDETRKAEG